MDNEVSFAEYLENSKWKDLVSLIYKINIDRFKDIDVSYTISELKLKFTAIDNIFDELINNNVVFDNLSLFFYKFNILMEDCLNYKNGIQKYIPISQLKVINGKIIDEILLLIYDNKISTPNIFENEVAALRSQTSNDAIELKQLREEIAEALRQAQESLKNIKNLERELSSGQGENGLIKTKIEDIYSTIESKRKAIFKLHDTLINDHKDALSLSYQINSARDQAVENNKKSEEQYKEISKIKSNILEFNDKIFGNKDSEGDLKSGLAQEFENKRIELSEFTVAHQTKYNVLIEEIEDLLPKATTAGLSNAFSEMRRSFGWAIMRYTVVFIFTILIILSCGIYETANILELVSKDASYLNSIKFLNNIIFKLPLLIPMVWLAIFASKRRSEYIRLQQEYAHKEVLAKTYEGFKKQIIDLGKDGEPLMDKLIANAIIAISFNPSTTLDGRHGDKPPFIGAFEKLITRAEKLLPESKASKDK